MLTSLSPSLPPRFNNLHDCLQFEKQRHCQMVDMLARVHSVNIVDIKTPGLVSDKYTDASGLYKTMYHRILLSGLFFACI